VGAARQLVSRHLADCTHTIREFRRQANQAAEQAGEYPFVFAGEGVGLAEVAELVLDYGKVPGGAVGRDLRPGMFGS
jgi:hypothetical protein